MNYNKIGKELIQLSNDILFASYEMKRALEKLNDACDKQIEDSDLEYEERDELESNLGCGTNEMFNLNK